MIVYLFGDQAEDNSAGLQTLLLAEHDPILAAFLTQSYNALRCEISLITPHSTGPRYSSLLDLVNWKRQGIRHIPLEHALTTLYQISLFMRHCHQRAGIYPNPSDSLLVGLCTGALAVAVISRCRSLSELLPCAVQAVITSFRLGRLVSETASRIEIPDSTPDSWAFTFPGLSEDQVHDLVKEFIEAQTIPVASKPYISSISPRSVTVAGPPDSLYRFQNSKKVSSLKFIRLPIHAPYHAPHLYSAQDAAAILSSDPLVSSSDFGAFDAIPVLSAATGETRSSTSMRHALEIAVNEILRKKLRLDLISNALGSCIAKSNHTTRERNLIIPIATSAAGGLAAGLQNKGVGIEVTTDSGFKDDQLSTNNIPCSITTLVKPKPIAIVGLSGRFPGAADVGAFWDILVKGLDVHSTVPPQRWDIKTHVDVSGKIKNTSATPYGCWLDNPEMFDARFFGISPREAAQIDPAQRLALMTAYEAIEQAGMVPDGSPSTRRDRVGVSYGVTSNDWMETNSAQDIDTYFIPGGNRAFIPGRVNYHFKFSGPSYCIDTACSSSLTAIYIACNSLWRGEADTILAGGTNILTNPDFTSGLDRGFFLSRTGNCKTFDDTADGYCRGEGVVTLVLKRLEDALAENDPVLAVISNGCTNHSAESESITRPFVGAQKAAVEQVLAGVNPYDVSYAEMHGTGTQTGDATEMSSVLACLAPASSQSNRARDSESHPLFLGAAKANVGHGEAAAGATSLAKVVLMMQNDTIPPHCGIKTKVNSKFPSDLAARGVFIPNQPVEWKRNPQSPRRVLVNNFSAAGGNTTLLVEDAPSRNVDNSHLQKDPRSVSVVVISAKTSSALVANVRKLLDFLDSGSQNESLSLPSLAYTTTARRMHHVYRIAVSAYSLESLREGLQHAIDRGVGQVRPQSAPTVNFAFSGQGSQYVGMGRDLFDAISSFRADICRYDHVAQTQGFPSILPVITMKEGDITQYSPLTVQLAAVSLEMALARLWKSWGIQPGVVVGHSLGHYAALNCAGVLSETDTIFLVGMRAQLLEQKCRAHTHLMLAVKARLPTLQPLLDQSHGTVEVACINGPEDVVLSGPRRNIEDLAQTLHARNIKAIALKTPYAFHSAQVDCILEEFVRRARAVIYHTPSIPVICPLSGEVVHRAGVFGPEHLAAHCRGQVNIVRALEVADSQGFLQQNINFLEIGDHHTFSNMLRSIFHQRSSRPIVLPSLTKGVDTWKTISEVLATFYMAGINVQWREYHSDFISSLSVVSLPAYSWDLKPFWIQYVNDWSLRKGDPPPAVLQNKGIANSMPPRLLSTTIHSIVHEDVGQTTGSLIVQSDLFRDDLYPLVQGHKVNGIPLCTPSVYADIALSLGTYLQERYKPTTQQNQIAIRNMKLERALVVQGTKPQLLRTAVEIDWLGKTASCRFSSVDANGNISVEHASCTIQFAQEYLPPTTQSAAELVRQIKLLREGLASDRCYKYNRSMIYRMVATVAEFDTRYRGLKEIILDSDSMTASSVVDFRIPPGQLTTVDNSASCFHTNPAHIDAFSQIAGFVMNGNDNSNLEEEVYVNHGWESFELYARVDPAVTYQCYVQMTNKEETLYQGSVMILDGEKLIGKFENIKLLGVNKRLLHSILSLANNEQSKSNNEKHGLGIISQVSNVPATNPRSPRPESISESIVHEKVTSMLGILVAESGVDEKDLHDDAQLASIGIDSLLSLIITSRLKEDIGFNTRSGATVFDEFRTVGELKNGVAKYFTSSPSSQSSAPSLYTPSEECVEEDESNKISITTTPMHNTSVPPSPSDSDLDNQNKASHAAQFGFTDRFTDHHEDRRHCSSVILQGPPTFTESGDCSSSLLFLFPDGSGSAKSYVDIPRVNETLTIIGLISPYRKDPEAMRNSSLDSLIFMYLAEIRRRQPRGPYNLGGWSAGGILAYRAMTELIKQGDSVKSLILIDSPDPTAGLDRLPQRFYDHCREQGVFGQIEHAGDQTTDEDAAEGKSKHPQPSRSPPPPPPPPSWLIPHFNATIDILHDYHAEPLRKNGGGSTDPRVSLYWATECVFDGVEYSKLPSSSEKSDSTKFLTERRTDFTAGGWAQLFPGRELRVYKAEGANHFSMMHGEHAKALARFIDLATHTDV